jgi:SpoVK/Ycf46/Vps4 family AAA+-type ATPase
MAAKKETAVSALEAMRSQTPAIRELDVLIKSVYPMIYVQTHEEERAKQALKDIARNNNLSMYEYTIANGLRPVQGEMSEADQKRFKRMSPEDVLGHISTANESAIFYLKDFHSFMKDATIVRFMRDIINDSMAEVSKDTYKPIIVSSPVLQIPVEIEKLTHVVKFSLPCYEEIEKIVTEATVPCELSLDHEEMTSIIRSCQGLTIDEIYNILSKSFVEKGTFDISVILEDKKQVIQKSGVLEYYENLEKFADVGGMDLLKDWIGKRSAAFSDEAKAFGLPDPKGILLLGIQGCGKSLVCKSISGLWKVPLIKMDVGRVMSGLVGSSVENMRKALATAESISPCILWLDEIEKGLAGSGSSNFST